MLTPEEERLIPAEYRAKSFADNRVVYQDDDVLSAAKKRIKHCLRMTDRCAVSYSGGKDSHVILYLVRSVMDEMGMKDTPLDVIFRDEELIPDPVIEHVLKLRERPDRWNLHYFAVPMRNQIFVMGKHTPYIQWDEGREWVRPKPEGAITQLHPDNTPLRQTEMMPLTLQYLGLKGKVGVFNGIRATESLLRFRASNVKRGPENYISLDGGGARNNLFIKPIYDWAEADVFRYFWENGLTYCKIYDAEMWSGAPLRVSTPLHEQAFGYLRRLRAMYPRMFEQIVHIFPEVATHERYWMSVDRLAAMADYPKGFEGMMAFLDDKIEDPTNLVKARIILNRCRKSKINNRRLGKYADGGCFGFPLLHVWQKLVKGDYVDGIPNHSNPTPEMMAFELAAETEANEEHLKGGM